MSPASCVATASTPVHAPKRHEESLPVHPPRESHGHFWSGQCCANKTYTRRMPRNQVKQTLYKRKRNISIISRLAPLREWRNWQTRKTSGLGAARPWGVKSLLPEQGL